MEQAFNEVETRIKNEHKAINNTDDIVKNAVGDIKEYAKAPKFE